MELQNTPTLASVEAMVELAERIDAPDVDVLQGLEDVPLDVMLRINGKMQPILTAQKINIPKEQLEFIYHVPEELKADIIRKLAFKTKGENYQIDIQPIKITLSKPNDS